MYSTVCRKAKGIREAVCYLLPFHCTVICWSLAATTGCLVPMLPIVWPNPTLSRPMAVGFRPISHCCEYLQRTFVASTRSKYSERVLIHIETSTINARETNPRIIRSTQLHFIKTCIQLIECCGNCYCYICYDILWRLAVDEAYHVAASHETKTIIIFGGAAVCWWCCCTVAQGPSTQKMFQLNILECRLHSKWDDQGQKMVTIRRLSYTANGWNVQDGKERALYRWLTLYAKM